MSQQFLQAFIENWDVGHPHSQLTNEQIAILKSYDDWLAYQRDIREPGHREFMQSQMEKFYG